MEDVNRRYDLNNMYDSIRWIPRQIQYVLADCQFDCFGSLTSPIHEVLIVGMGSSLISFKLVASLYEDSFSVPVSIINGPNLPKWADKNTLVILSSYSGNSVEVLSCAKSAIKQHCITVGISTGGKLVDMINDHSHFIYRVDPSLHNPCQQPRMAIGFSFAAYLKILHKLKILTLPEKSQKEIVEIIKKINLCLLEKDAKSYSKTMRNKYINITSSGFLSGNAELFCKQLNWNAKQYSSLYLAPEAMHHVFEGISNSGKVNNVLFVILTSILLKKSERKNLEIAAQYLMKLNIPTLIIDMKANSKFKIVLNGIMLSSFITFYLSMFYKQNPTPTPAITYYKINYRGNS
jgi:glucose/mannose-6-phosphate isomerase